MFRAVFLDRDGVLNTAIVRDKKPCSPSSLAEFALLPGVPEACAALRAAGFLLLVVTNQPDVARGRVSRGAVESIHRVLRATVGVDDIFVCYHDDRDACLCRKPAPGLLLQAARERQINLFASYLVGDRWKDIEAGRRAGCRTIFIDHGYPESKQVQPDYQAPSLAEAAAWILSQSTISFKGSRKHEIAL
jgi:D-glycero-D-manno-heptose 1,7-bisphosphate phosphatase